MDMEIEIEIRQMEIDDIPEVYHLGEELFHGSMFTTLYRTWDAYEVTTGFNQDPELCLVAERADSEIVGFALGTTYEKPIGAWKYGYIAWLGVASEYQGRRVGTRLYEEMERRMRDEDVRMILVDTAESNKPALEFFSRRGFGKPSRQVWMSKVLRRVQAERKAGSLEDSVSG